MCYWLKHQDIQSRGYVHGIHLPLWVGHGCSCRGCKLYSSWVVWPNISSWYECCIKEITASTIQKKKKLHPLLPMLTSIILLLWTLDVMEGGLSLIECNQVDKGRTQVKSRLTLTKMTNAWVLDKKKFHLLIFQTLNQSRTLLSEANFNKLQSKFQVLPNEIQ